MTELSAQEVVTIDGGNGPGIGGSWGSYLHDLYYSNGVGELIAKCGAAFLRRHRDVDASLNTGTVA